MCIRDRYPGALGNSLQVSVCRSANDYLESSTGTLTIAAGNNIATTSQNETTSGGTSLVQVGDKIKFGNSTVGVFYLEVTAANTTNPHALGVTPKIVFNKNREISLFYSVSLELFLNQQITRIDTQSN